MELTTNMELTLLVKVGKLRLRLLDVLPKGMQQLCSGVQTQALLASTPQFLVFAVALRGWNEAQGLTDGRKIIPRPAPDSLLTTAKLESAKKGSSPRRMAGGHLLPCLPLCQTDDKSSAHTPRLS